MSAATSIFSCAWSAGSAGSQHLCQINARMWLTGRFWSSADITAICGILGCLLEATVMQDLLRAGKFAETKRVFLHSVTWELELNVEKEMTLLFCCWRFPGHEEEKVDVKCESKNKWNHFSGQSKRFHHCEASIYVRIPFVYVSTLFINRKCEQISPVWDKGMWNTWAKQSKLIVNNQL